MATGRPGASPIASAVSEAGAGDDALRPALVAQAFGDGARLAAAQLGERLVDLALDEPLDVALGLAVADQQQRHGRYSVSLR